MNRLNIELEDLNYDMEEEFKTLRTNLMFCGVDKKVILITSTFPGEGKTEKSVYLSAALAKMNKKVLLLDMDLRSLCWFLVLKWEKYNMECLIFYPGNVR